MKKIIPELIPYRSINTGIRRVTSSLPDNLVVFERNSQTLGGAHFHQSERFSMIYCLQGRGTISLETSQFTLTPGHLVFSFPWQLHCYPKISKNIRWLFVSSNWSPPDNVFRLRSRCLKVHQQERELIYRLVKTWNDASLAPTPWKADYMTCLFGTIVCGLLDNLHEETSEITAMGDTLVTLKLAEQINHHLATNPQSQSVFSLAKTMGYSPNYLSSIFKKKYRITLKQYLLSIRLDRAKTLLAAKKMSVGEIADQLGFRTINAFSNSFRRITGFSPINYRKKCNEK